MERIFEDLVHFANTNTLNEPLFDSPMGRLNIKQAGIAGVGCLAIAMYALDTMNLLVIPLMIIPLILGLSSRGNQTMDMYIMSWFMFKIRGSSTSLIKNKKLAKKKAATESTSRAMKIKSKSKTIKK